jgi:predicted ATPase/class 3 adenylate cyclase/Tfp pilus assembly protein PilF
MAVMPTGTVTFLFTDIEGSTRLWERDASAMQSALARHDGILRSAIEERDGHVFKTVGDAFCAAFSSAPEALGAAISAQRALHDEEWEEGGVIRVRMALHTGAVDEQGGDYFGPALNRVARLLSAGHGGQTLLSLATQELVRDALPLDARLEDLGERRLKDLYRPERVFQITVPDLPSEFPPLRTLESLRNNLPLQPTPLVGRQREVGEVCWRLGQEEVRLLTLTGPGGTGKTRLALQAAADVLENFEDGVFFVSLAAVTDPDLFYTEVAGALGLRESGGVTLEELLKEYVVGRELLLLLDNFEQVLEAAPLVGELLSGAPRLKVLATSRMPLGIYGEHEYAVPPLSVPDPKHLPDLGALSQYEAVRLFIERAGAAKASFEITSENASAIAEICARLDGLPLAIELAAARVKLLPPKVLLARLSNRLKLLTGGAKDLPARQRTLRGAIGWSHDLLEEGEKTLFARLAAFSGGRTLEAIEAICDAEGDLPVDALDGVSSLLDKNLLVREETSEEESRFVMLETIHEYAREKLLESGEAAELSRLHAAYFLAFAEEAEPELAGPDQVWWMERLEADHDNFRAALSRLLEVGEVESALRIGSALWWFWRSRGHLSEGRRWLSEGLSGGDAAPVGVRARAMLVLGDLDVKQGDYPQGEEELVASLALCREVEDRRGEARTLGILGWIASERNDLERAEKLLEEGLALGRKAGTPVEIHNALNGLAVLASYRDDYARASVLHEEGLGVARAAGDVRGIAIHTNNLGNWAMAAGEFERAEALLREARELSWKVGDLLTASIADLNLGNLALAQNDFDLAEKQGLKVILGLRERAEVFGIDDALDILASVAAWRGEIRRAARIWGGVEGYRDVRGVPWSPDEREMIEPHIEAARTQLDGAAWEEEWERGRSMSLDQTVGYALEGVGERAWEQG